MKINEKIAIGAVIAAMSATTMNYVKTRRQEKMKRDKIEQELKENLKAIHIAEGRVLERLKYGAYSGKAISEVMNDFEFEIIRFRLED